MQPIIIVGSGLAGYTVAREFRRLNPNIPLQIITSDEGDFYSKPMLSNAFFLKKAPQELVNVPASRMAVQLNAEIFPHTHVTQLLPEQHALLVGKECFPYNQLVLACGATPLPLNFDQGKIFYVNHLSDYSKFREVLRGVKRITIIGAGLIGCEFADDLQQAGFLVTVIGRGTYPLNRIMPEAVGRVLQKALENLGVTWQLGKTVLHIENTSPGYRLTLSDHSFVETDIILSATGLRPRTELAASAGLTVRQGIVVNRHLQTNVDNIFALGDCAEVEGLVLPYVMPLMNAARVIASNLTGQFTLVSYPAFPIVVKTTTCPMVAYLPPVPIQGQWEIEAQGQDVRALFYRSDGELVGFALTGTKQTEKMALLKKVPPLLK